MQGLHSSLSGDLSQAGTSAEGAGGQFHSADRSGHRLCSVQPPLSAGLSMGCVASHVFWESSLVGAEADGCLQHQAQLQIGFPAQAQQEQPLENH